MKLVVLGATGGTGIEIVRQAVAQRHSVTAFVRSPSRQLTGLSHLSQLTVKQGDLLNSAAMADAIQEHDAVLSGFGPRVPIAKEDAHLLRDFAYTLTAAMQRTGVKRVVVISTAFLFKDAILPPAYLFGRLFFPGVVADASAMERIFAASGLDWTIVRPPQLTDKPHTGKYRVREAHLPSFGFKISRADVADCFLKTVADPASIRRVLGVSH
jgi:putative NADH-flavin reductase